MLLSKYRRKKNLATDGGRVKRQFAHMTMGRVQLTKKNCGTNKRRNKQKQGKKKYLRNKRKLNQL